MNIKDLKTLIQLVTDTDINEFSMETADDKIVIKRGVEKEVIHMAAPVAVAPVAAPVAAAPAADVAPAAVVRDSKYETITSPIVGTLYHKSSPDAENFVAVGSVVEKGQTVGLIEAMKLFNEIEADFKCKIIEILKSDASPVEYGDELFLVERL